MDKQKSPTLKDLRLFFSIWSGIFALFFLSGIFLHDSYRIWAIAGLGASLFFLALPHLGAWIYHIQVRLGTGLGWCISRLSLVLLFACVFVPLALLFRLIGRDVLERKIDSSRASYFKPRIKQPTSMKNQF